MKNWVFIMNVLTTQWTTSTYDLLCCLSVTIRGLVCPSNDGSSLICLRFFLRILDNECIDSTVGRMFDVLLGSIHECLMCYLVVTIRGLIGPSNDIRSNPCIFREHCTQEMDYKNCV